MLDIGSQFTVKRKKTTNITVFREKMWYYTLCSEIFVLQCPEW